MSVQRTALLLLTIFFSVFVLGCANDEEKMTKHYQRALEYIKIGDDKNAVLELKNALKIDAKYADARYQLGLLYLQQNQPQAAFSELLRTASLDPANLDASVKVAEFQLLSKKNEESRKLVEHVLSIDPNYLDGLTLLANLDQIEGKLDEAETAINKAINISPETAKLYNVKGRILRDKGLILPAEQALRKAVELDPDTFTNHQSLLMFYEKQGNQEAMNEVLNSMASRFPDNPQLQLMLARIHEKNNEFAEAEAALKNTITDEENTISFRILLANFYTKRGQASKAEEFIKDSLKLFPDNLQLQLALNELLFEEKKFEEAKSMNENILAGNPQNGGALLIKARFYIHEDNNDKAIETLSTLLSDYPKWDEPFYYSALTYLRTGKLKLAQSAVQHAIENSPKNDRFHALAAQIYLVQRSSAEAIKEARTALSLNPRNFVAVKILTKSLVQAKEYDDAMQLITRLNQNAVDNDAEILESKALAQLGLGRKDEARTTLTRLLELNPSDVKALALLTAVHAPKDLDKAISFVKNHLKTHKHAGIYILLGELYEKNKNPEAALSAFQEAQKRDPENSQSYLRSARILQIQGKLDAAIGEYSQLLAKYPDSIDGLIGSATAYETKGDHAKAKEYYKKALVLRPELPVASNNLAMIIAQEEGGDLGEALRLAMQAKQGMPNEYFVSDTLGWVHYKRGSYGLAITQFEMALRANPDNPTVLYHLGLAQHAGDEQTKAIESLQKALEKNRKFADREEAEKTLATWMGKS